MLQKFQKISLKTDAQNGEDEERGEKTMQTKEAGKKKSSPTISESAKSEDLRMLRKIQKCCSRQRKIGLLSEMALKQLPCLEIEVEFRGGDTKNNEPGSQRHDKIKKKKGAYAGQELQKG